MRAAYLTNLKKRQLPKEAVFSVLLLIKNQQYFIFKKINSSCQLLAGCTHIKTFYRSLLNLQKGLHSLKFRELETALQTSICFSDIHSPWQHGSNENINGWLRFFLPRGMDFRNLEDGYLETDVSLLNNRPRKCLGLKSPHKVFCCT